MKRHSWQIFLGLALLALSTFFYYLHFLVFHDAHHIFIYLVGDIAFVFIEVLLVTLIIHQVLERRERRSRLDKLNMVIGVFFSEVGSRLLEMLSSYDPGTDHLQQELAAAGRTPEAKFQCVKQWLNTHEFRLDASKTDWNVLQQFLAAKKAFMLRLLENPNLLEHEAFTDMLWAVFHLAEELGARETLQGLPDEDIQHLRVDMNRVYGQLALQWLDYMKHLKTSYTYLFSLALRMNPFNRNASAVIQGS